MLMRKSKKKIEQSEIHRNVFKYVYAMWGYFWATESSFTNLLHFVRRVV